MTISAQPTSQPSANTGGGGQPTSKPSSRDGGNSGGGGHSHNNANNNGNSNNNGGGKKPPANNGGSNNGGSSTQSTTSGSSTVVEDPVVDNTDVEVADPGPSNTQPSAPVTEAAPSPAEVPTPEPTVANTDDASDSSTETYLTSPEPVETKSAPVWVVPGILLMLTSMLALLGGVLGRGSKPVKVRDES